MAVEAGAIKAGQAYVELAAKSGKLDAALAAAGKKLAAFGSGLAAIAASGIQADLLKLAPVGLAVAKFTEYGSMLDDVSQRTGATVEEVAALSHAAKMSGADAAAVEQALKGMNEALYQAAAGGGEATQAFAALGLSAGRLMSLSVGERFEEIGDALSRVADPGFRAALAMKVFKEGGIRLLPALAEGKAGLRAFAAEAQRLGLVLTGDQAKAAAELGDAWDRIKGAALGAAVAIGSALAPTIKDAASWLTRAAVNLGAWLRDNEELVASTVKSTIAFIAFEGVLWGVGKAIAVVGLALPALSTGLAATKVALAALTSPAGLVVAAVAGIGAAVLYQSGVVGQAVDWMGGRFADLASRTSQVWEGIVDAFAAGDLGLAAKVAWLGVKQAWAVGIGGISSLWEDFSGWVVNTGDEALTGFRLAWNDALAAIENAWSASTTWLASTWSSFVGFLKKSWNSFGGFFARVWARIKSVFKSREAAQEEIDRIRKETDAENAAVDQAGAEKAAEREAERARRRKEIEAGRRAEEERLVSGQMGRKKEREREQADKAAEAQRELDEAKAALDAALAEAKRRRAGADLDDADGPRPPRIQDLSGAVRKASVVGTFQGSALPMLGGANPVEVQQLQEQKNIRKELIDLNRNVRVAAPHFA